MTVETLITECRRLSEVLDNHYLGDLDPVVHLTYSEAIEVYEAMDSYVEVPIPGTFWVDCYGIRLFVERIDG